MFFDFFDLTMILLPSKLRKDAELGMKEHGRLKRKTTSEQLFVPCRVICASDAATSDVETNSPIAFFHWPEILRATRVTTIARAFTSNVSVLYSDDDSRISLPFY